VLYLVIWPLALPFILKEMFAELPKALSEPELKGQIDSMIGVIGVARTDLRPSGSITIKDGVFLIRCKKVTLRRVLWARFGTNN